MTFREILLEALLDFVSPNRESKCVCLSVKNINVGNRIVYINQRLKEIAEEAKGASETMKVFLRQGYRLLLDERRKLIKTAKKETPTAYRKLPY